MIITKKCGFKWYYSFLVAFIYVPSALFYYNNDTVIYSVLYIIMYIVGTLIQLNIRKNKPSIYIGVLFWKKYHMIY